MPGIGVRTASNILLGIGGDIANFKIVRPSGRLRGHIARHRPIRHQHQGERPSAGQQTPQNALWQTAFVASTKHPPSVACTSANAEQGKTPQHRHHLPRASALRRDLHRSDAQKREPLPEPASQSLNRATRGKDAGRHRQGEARPRQPTGIPTRQLPKELTKT